MKHISGRELSQKFRALQAAERYIITSAQRKLSLDKAQRSSGIDFAVIALAAYAVTFLATMVMLASTTSLT